MRILLVVAVSKTLRRLRPRIQGVTIHGPNVPVLHFRQAVELPV